ncbi:hypothetical protein BC835DRAFT_1419661 [Cytidiella melzeri]|nr:hypothetical protein BC835DRAFT_1419661 [Cytidiella melzeri]
MVASKAPAILTLATTSLLAAYLIFVIPPSSVDLFPQSTLAYEKGSYPDGLSLRRHYTGIYILDRILTAYGGFFALVVDGRDVATWLFCLWFLPQLTGVLVFCYWEAGRVRKGGFAARPTWVCLTAQALTAGVTLPFYFISHLLNVPIAPNTPLPLEPVSKARALFPAVALGYLLPSMALLFPLPSFSLDTIQLISAFWQPFPVYIALALYTLQNISSDMPIEGYFKPLKRAYMASGILSAASHIGVIAYILTATDPACSFASVFLPPYWFPVDHGGPPLPAYRTAARMLFQHDWLTMTLAAFVFFVWSRKLSSRPGSQGSLGLWALVSFVLGPGAGLCWAAVKREEGIWEARKGVRVQ